MRAALSLFLIPVTAAGVVAGVVGVFQGRIVRPEGVKAEAGVLYVRARHGMARKVRVEKAVIEYDEDVPEAQRKKDATKSLCDDVLVRVTAEQSDAEDGAWRALNILILPDPDAEGQSGARLRQASMQKTANPREARPKAGAQTPSGKPSGPKAAGSGSSEKAAETGFCTS